MKCGLRSQAAGVKSRPSSDMEGIIKKSSMAPQHESAGHEKLGEEGLLAFPSWPPDSATAGWAGGSPLSQWWEKAKRALHRVKYPFWSGLAPRSVPVANLAI